MIAKSWKHRLFVLSDRRLVYYAVSNVEALQKGEVSLIGASLEVRWSRVGYCRIGWDTAGYVMVGYSFVDIGMVSFCLVHNIVNVPPSPTHIY